MEQAREKAIEIIEEFEQLLSENNIKIPSEDREGEDDEACIYGREYYTLEHDITEIIEKAFLNDTNKIKIKMERIKIRNGYFQAGEEILERHISNQTLLQYDWIEINEELKHTISYHSENGEHFLLKLTPTPEQHKKGEPVNFDYKIYEANIKRAIIGEGKNIKFYSAVELGESHTIDF
jgi:hypothetical protein